MAKMLLHSKTLKGNPSMYRIHLTAASVHGAGLQDKECEVEFIPAKDGKPGQIIIKAKEE